MYPVTYEADYLRERNRLTVFFRYLLAIPWMIMAVVYYIAALVVVLLAWFAIVITGRYPTGLYNFNAGVIRYMTRFIAWLYLVTDQWPPFGLGDEPSYPIRVKIAPPQPSYSRAKAFFRSILAIPLWVMQSIMVGITGAAAPASWFTIVFRGYQPAGLHNALNTGMLYSARAVAYLSLLTERYPTVETQGLAADTLPSGESVAALPAPPPAEPEPTGSS
jgi:hypothetical protein